MKDLDLSDTETALKMQMVASILVVTAHHMGRVLDPPNMQEIADAYSTVERIFEYFRRHI